MPLSTPEARARRLPLLLVVTTALAVSGCAQASAPGEVPSPSDAAAGGRADHSPQQGEVVAPWGGSTTQFLTAVPLDEGHYFVMRPPPPEDAVSAAARISGELGLLSGGCFGVIPDTVVVWPAGTTALADGTGVQLADGRVLRRGAFLEAGGGYSDVEFTGRASDCPGRDVAFVNDPAA